jgi:phenylalanyl-tRNA synthetase beta chain
MWLSLNIISKMVDISDLTAEEIANQLTMSTAEIESIEKMHSHFETIVTGKVASVSKHPNADKLTVCDIDTGNDKLRVVCGAPNHKEGDIVALAKVGTRFTEEFTVNKTKIRGEESFGMLCSEKELGLSDDHSGIMILPEDTPLGKPLSDLYKDWMDTRLEIDNKSITHRPDLWSHYGFAREIGALFNKPVKDPVDYSIQDSFKNEEKLKVSIKDGEAAPRYSGLVVKNIKIGESPDWLKAAVTSIGMRPINNIVDITNYVMSEIGEPMHAFDRKKLRGNEIIVRMAGDKETLMTLDGKEFTLSKEDIVIADEGGAIALAGVMGGGNSEIEDNTDEIVLEAANFNPVSIRKTAHRYNQRTEAAIRFEKSLSPELTTAALIRCYELIKEIIPGAEAASPIIDDYPTKLKPATIETTTDFIRRRIGVDIEDERIVGIIESLNYELEKDLPKLTIRVPHYRATKDVSIPEDIVEEVGRVYGYGNIAPTAPLVPCGTPNQNRFRLFERQVKDILSNSQNMVEVSGYSFTGEDILNKLNINEEKELHLKNALSIEHDRLRRTIVQNIIANIELNQKYNDSFKIYEQGRVYQKDDRKSSDLISEITMVTGAVYIKKAEQPVFYDGKNIVKNLLKKLHIENYELKPETKKVKPYLHPGRTMSVFVEGKKAGEIGEIHPDTKKQFDITGEAVIFELNVDTLFKADKTEKRFKELQKYPEVPFEVSVLTEKHTYSNEICSLIESCSNYITSTDVISIYEGDPIPEDKKSVSIRTVFSSEEKTLSPGEIEEVQNKIVKTLNKKGYQLR